MRRISFALALAACTRAAPPVPRAAPDPPMTQAAPATPLDAAALDGPHAWTDDVIVAALAQDCRFVPQSQTWTCNMDMYEQSCVLDPCFEDAQHGCASDCRAGCASCGSDCVDACERCKKPCTDDACRGACAKTCATCRQDCLAARDRCETGTCAPAYDTCRVRLKARWLASNCRAACPTYRKCWQKCQESGEEACLEACRSKVKRACPEDLVDLCPGWIAIDPTKL